MSNLPVWVQWVQALGVPIFLAAVALAGAWVGWQQMQVARVKLQLDLYERRYKVFEALRDLIRHGGGYEVEPDAEEIRSLAFTAGQAAFLFDKRSGVADYVQDMRRKVSKVRSLPQEIAETEGEKQENLRRDLNSLRLYLRGVVDPTRTHEDHNLITKFSPSLVLPKVRTFPWK